MARKMFTQEQVRVMAENPYTLHVSTTQITFTNAFKEEFWRRYQEGDTPRTIMYDLGYDPEVLGRNRLSGIQNVVCKQAVSAKGFHERPQRRRGEGYAEGGDTTQAQLRQMQHRLKYLEQEVEFLKKYPLPGVCESKGRGHERGFHHLLPDPSDIIRKRERIIRIHDVPDSRGFQIRLLCVVKSRFGQAGTGSTGSR